MKENKIKKIPLKNMKIKDYEEIQRILESKYTPRLSADIEAWDIVNQKSFSSVFFSFLNRQSKGKNLRINLDCYKKKMY